MKANKKLGFFKKVKIAIFNLEKYGELIAESLGKAIKYIIILSIICSICLSILDIGNIIKMVDKGIDYIINQMPDFEVNDGEINIKSEVYGYDEEYDIKILSIDKNNLTDTQLKEQGKDEKAIILLKDKIILNVYGTYNEYSYNEIKQYFNLEKFSKQGIIDLYNELGGNSGIAITLFITFILVYFIVNLYEILLYAFIVAIFGYFVAQIAKIKINFLTSFVLAIYSLTLSILLNLIYIMQYNFTGFEIPYFNVLYLGIAYIYIIAAILIIKSDLVKQVIEIQKKQSEENQILEENNDKDQEGKEDKEESKKEDKKENKENEEKKDIDTPVNEEPDGSEI